MSEYLFNYERVDPTTWVYLSSLLSLGLFFKFNRFWSMRNLDLVLLILLAPGLLLVYYGRLEQRRVLATGVENAAIVDFAKSFDWETATEDMAEPAELVALRARRSEMREVEFSGFVWLIVINALLVIRLLVDPNMVRRPLLEPNLSAGGLTFICVSLFVFLMANVVASSPVDPPTKTEVQVAETLKDRAELNSGGEIAGRQPGYILLMLFPQIPTTPLTHDIVETKPAETSADNEPSEIGPGSTPEVVTGPVITADTGGNGALVTAARCIAIMSHLAIVLGIATVGYRHFDSMRTGIGAATLYLMLPYTAQMTGHIEHSIPAALLVWAVVFYRRPATAGVFLGLAMGCYYYPLFLLPLWISFYWQRGLGRFLGGVLSMLAVLIALLLLKTSSGAEFLSHLRTMFGVWFPLTEGLQGVWGLGWNPWYRVPVLALFVGIISTLAIWPAQKNLGTLISCSCAVMVATQFWHGFGGGLYMGWFLPLLLLTIFRPNLEDRIALSVLGEVWFPRRKRIAA